MPDLRSRIEKMFKEIEEIEKIDQDYVWTYITEPPIDAVITKVQKEIGRELPESILSFYSNVGELQLQWDYFGEDEVGGKIRIPDLASLFSNKIQAITNADGGGRYPFWSKSLPQNEMDRLSKFFVLDNLNRGNVVLFKLDRDMPEPELYLFTHLNTLTPMRLNFTEYIKTVLETRGMFLWQQYATMETHFKNGLAIQDNFFENMRQIFPDADISNLSRELTPPGPTRKELQKKDYAVLFKQRVAELEKKSHINVTEFKTYPGAAAANLIKAQETLGRKLPESMMNFYACTNGLRLKWEWQNQTWGEINILPLEKIMGGEGAARKIDWNDSEDHKGYLWFEEFEDEDIDFLKGLRPFDKIYGFSGEQTAIKLTQNDLELYFLRPRIEDKKLPLSFEEYLDYLLTFMGLLAWQRIVTEGEEIIIRNKPIKEYLKELFPEVAWEKYVRK